MNTLRLAGRNVRRNWQRSLVTMLAMAFACGMMIFFSALMEGMMIGSERSVVSMNLGDIQIHAPGYRNDPDLYTRIEHEEPLLQKLHQAGFRATGRLYAYGLIAANMASSGVQLRATDLQNEIRTTELYAHIGRGQWLDAGDAMGVVLGKKLAATLGVNIGDELVFVGQRADGYMANEIFKVRGILKSVSDGIDRMGMYLPMQSFRELMGVPEGVHEIVVVRADQQLDLEEATSRIEKLAMGLEVKNWKALMPVVARMIETAGVQIIIMLVIFYIAVATVVLNAMLMNVFERIHEFGIMKALGVTPAGLLALVICEAMLMAVVAALAGLAGGWWVASYYQQHGIDMSGLAGSISYGGIAFDPVWYAVVTPNALMMPVLFLILIAAIAVIYPAAKAAMLRPVQAIYHR